MGKVKRKDVSSTVRKERKCLQLSEKLTVIKAKESGISAESLAQQYGVDKSTIGRIVRDKTKILESAEKFSSKAKKFSSTKYDDVNRAVLKWFYSMRRAGIPISGTGIQSQALSFATKFGNKEFRASNGWLTKLLKRNNITLHACKGEKLSGNPADAENFKKHLMSFLRENDYTDVDLYNADETGKLNYSLAKLNFNQLSLHRINV